MTAPAAGQSQLGRERWLIRAVLALMLLPVVYMFARSWAATRNIAYLDDIDGTLMLLVRLREGGSWTDVVRWLFEVSNEHRMVTSRFLYLLSYGLTGTVNFAVFAVIGNLFLVGLCAVLLRSVETTERRLTLGLLLAALLFQLQHFENFFWSGSSIDHFQVPFLAALAVMFLSRGSWGTCFSAVLCAFLATLTLAHGLVLWPVGALVLLAQRRWHHFGLWVGMAAIAAVGYFVGFEFNPAHQVGGFSPAGAVRIFSYWLELIGAPLAFEHQSLAAALGAVLVAVLGWHVATNGLRREPVALPLAIWAVLALGLMSLGRVNLGGGVMASRYYVLSALAWTLGGFVTIDRLCAKRAVLPLLWWAVPALAAFNVAADIHFDGRARRWVASRDEALANFVQHGRDGMAAATLHPLPDHATRVIRQAEELGVFLMPEASTRTPLPRSYVTGPGLSFAIDRIAAGKYLLMVDGWAAVAGRPAKPGDVQVVLRSSTSTHVFTTLPVLRPDVSAAIPAERWQDAGFKLAVRRWLLPQESYQLGLLVPTERGPQLQWTDRRIELGGDPYTIETDKVAPDRAVYDEVFLRGPSTTVASAPGKFMRVSFFDLNGGLVHIDFNGHGELRVDLKEIAVLDPPPRENGRPIAYAKGAADITIRGADESSNIAVYAARRQPQRGSGIMIGLRAGRIAHIGSISILSRNGKFGAVRTGNVRFSAHDGLIGVHAPDVQFTGPVNVGDIVAFGTAIPHLTLGSAAQTRIVAGDLHQPNGEAVRVSGVTQLLFVEGRTAQGRRLRADINRGLLLENGVDVSQRIAGGRAAWTGANSQAEE